MWYLKSAFDTYAKVQDAVQNRLGEVQSAILSPVDLMRRFLGSAPAVPTIEKPPDSEVEALRRRVAELEKTLQKAPRRKKTKTKKH